MYISVLTLVFCIVRIPEVTDHSGRELSHISELRRRVIGFLDNPKP